MSLSTTGQICSMFRERREGTEAPWMQHRESWPFWAPTFAASLSGGKSRAEKAAEATGRAMTALAIPAGGMLQQSCDGSRATSKVRGNLITRVHKSRSSRVHELTDPETCAEVNSVGDLRVTTFSQRLDPLMDVSIKIESCLSILLPMPGQSTFS